MAHPSPRTVGSSFIVVTKGVGSLDCGSVIDNAGCSRWLECFDVGVIIADAVGAIPEKYL